MHSTSDEAQEAELVSYPSIAWYARQYCNTADTASGYRHLAIGLETMMAKSGGVTLDKALTMIVKNGLFDLADRIDLE